MLSYKGKVYTSCPVCANDGKLLGPVYLVTSESRDFKIQRRGRQ